MTPIWSALRNGVRGMVAAGIAYPLAERLEGRDVRSKAAFVRAEIDRPFPERRGRAWARLLEQVRFAGNHVPYYRDLFASTGFDPDRLATDPSYYEALPYLTKDIIREQGARLLSENHPGPRHLARTGGSTGPSADIWYDQAAADWSSAITRESRRRIGSTPWRSALHFASKFPESFPLRDRVREAIKCFAMNRDNLFFASFAEEELEAMWRRVKAIRPYLLHAHPSTVDQLAAHVERTRGHDRGFAVFESSGELLQPRQRERIARVFGCTVIDRYGLAEAGVVGYQIDPASPDMRFYEFFAWPEIYTDGETGLGEVPPGSRAGELVITPLFNKLMPLLRYRTGDNAILAEQPEGLALTRMVGRIHDVVSFAGTPLPTHYIQDVLDRIGGVREFQIEIRAGKPVLRVVPEDGADAGAMLGRIASWWGDAVGIEFIALADLKLTGTRQKFRHLVATDHAESGAP